jgi:tetraacyldisaccharide 4'-kinase
MRNSIVTSSAMRTVTVTRVDLERCLENLWYSDSGFHRLLLPLAWVYCGWMVLRRAAYQRGLVKSVKPACKIIVVGNIVAGGSGKTPLVIALANQLAGAGLKVGLLCSGYRGQGTSWPRAVTAESDPYTVGDEAVLLARKTGLPVMAGRDRVAAANALLATGDFSVLICDDGLQHYALQRDLEIVTVDAHSRYGNGACLPAGPLREPVSRLRSVSAVIGLGDRIPGSTSSAALVAENACELDNPGNCRPLSDFAGRRVHAVAGIARAERFFNRLQAAGVELQKHAFSDHHPFKATDLPADDSLPILMTEKDAVKCQVFSRPNCWYVPVELELEADFVNRIIKQVSDEES